MVDKSIDHTNYPPFMTIVRGQICNVVGIFPRKDQYQVVLDADINQGGYINATQTTELNLKYIKPLVAMSVIDPKLHNYHFFDYNWDISKNQQNQLDN